MSWTATNVRKLPSVRKTVVSEDYRGFWTDAADVHGFVYDGNVEKALDNSHAGLQEVPTEL